METTSSCSGCLPVLGKGARNEVPTTVVVRRVRTGYRRVRGYARRHPRDRSRYDSADRIQRKYRLLASWQRDSVAKRAVTLPFAAVWYAGRYLRLSVNP